MDAAAPPPVCEPCDPPLRGWDRAAHVRYFLGLLSGLGNEYTGVETQRLSVVYFCVVGLDLLRALGELGAARRAEIVEFVYRMQVALNVSE